MDIRIFSCLFVKFVLYTAGSLGEGILPFFMPVPSGIYINAGDMAVF